MGEKEIENYTLVPRTIARYINARKKKGPNISTSEVECKLDEICETLKDDTFDSINQQFNYTHRPANPSEGNRYARQVFQHKWTSLSGKLSVVSGKAALSRVSAWTQNCFGIGLNALGLSRFMVREELDPELVSVMSAIESGTAFP